MGKNCGAKQCTGASQTAPSPPSAPKVSKGSGSRKMDTASVDTIDGRRSTSRVASNRTSSSACPPGCDPGVTTCPPGPSRSGQKTNVSASGDDSLMDESFLDLLISFMQRSYEIIKKYKENPGNKDYSMSHTAKMEKIQELLSLIAQKEAELSALEAEQAALNASGGGSGLMGQGAGLCADVSCQADCSPGSFTSPMMGYPQTPANSRVDYSGETERSVHDYTCSEECTGPDVLNSGFSDDSPYGYQMPRYDTTAGDMLNASYLPGLNAPQMIEDECQSECADVTGDMVNTGFMDDGSCDPQCYESYSQNDTSIGDILNTGFMEYNPQQYGQQYTPRAPTNSAMAGRSVSSCYCPPDSPAARYGRKR